MFRADVSAIGPRTLLRISEERQYTLAEETDCLILVIDERRVRLPLAVRPTLEAICTRGAFSPERLPRIVSLDAKLALVRYLYGLAFLVLSQPNSPASQ